MGDGGDGGGGGGDSRDVDGNGSDGNLDDRHDRPRNQVPSIQNLPTAFLEGEQNTLQERQRRESPVTPVTPGDPCAPADPGLDSSDEVVLTHADSLEFMFQLGTALSPTHRHDYKFKVVLCGIKRMFYVE